MQPLKLGSVYLSLVIALVLQMLPWSGFGLMLRPDFVLLTLLYWLLRAPQLCNIGTAWFAGLVIDLATGGLFGQNGLAYALTAYFAVSYQRRLALFTLWQQAGYVFVLLLVAQLILMILKLFGGDEAPGWHYFLPSITGILLWQLFIFSRLGADSHPHRT
jgi:rod shape-determining protein MreD